MEFIIETLCSLRLVLEGKTGKEIPKSSRLESYSVGTNEKSDFYKLWQQYKLLKTMEMSEVWPDTYNERYIHQFQPEATHKIH